MTTMTVQPDAPAEEQRGGTDPDWDRTRPGQPLPAKEDPELWDPPVDEVPDGTCPDDGCEDDRDLRDGYGVRADGTLHRRVGIGWHWCGDPRCGGD